jgi:hypothetical protein
MRTTTMKPTHPATPVMARGATSTVTCASLTHMAWPSATRLARPSSAIRGLTVCRRAPTSSCAGELIMKSRMSAVRFRFIKGQTVLARLHVLATAAVLTQDVHSALTHYSIIDPYTHAQEEQAQSAWPYC